MINPLYILKYYSYLKTQKNNLLYPNEKYLNSASNINKADLHRFRKVYHLHSNLQGKMLDIGCNDGYFMRKFPWKFTQYVGIDIYHIAQYTKGKYWFKRSDYTKGSRIRYLTGYFEDLAPKLGKFDFVFAGEIIEHVQNPELFIEALVVTLKPNSKWCITTPNAIGGDLTEHNRQYDKKTLSKLLSKFFFDFKIDELKPTGDSWPFLIAHGSVSKVKSTTKV